MKTINSILLFILMISFSSLAAQQPTVAGNFDNLEPTINYSYSVTFNQPNGTTASIEWIVIGGSKVSEALNSVTVKWENLPNFPNGPSSPSSHAIRAEITYFRNSQYDSKQSSERKTVTVLYISPITSFKINNNVISNKGDNILVPCNNQTITIEASAVTTEGSTGQITYNYLVPSGWSGHTSTLSPTATFTYNGGVGGEFVMYAKGANSNFIQGYGANVIRPLPEAPIFTNYGGTPFNVAGSNPIVCNPVNFSVNANGANSYNWQQSGGVSVSGSTSSTATVSASSDGRVLISGINGCGNGPISTKDVISSTPGIPNFTADANSSSSISMCAGNNVLLVADEYKASSFSFTQSTGPGYISPNGSNSAIYYGTSPGFTQLIANAINCKGQANTTKYVNVMNCGGYFKAGPNPLGSSDMLTVAFDKDTPEALLPERIVLYDGQKMALYSANVKEEVSSKRSNSRTFVIDTKKLSKGDYYLHVFNSQHPVKEKQLERIRIVMD